MLLKSSMILFNQFKRYRTTLFCHPQKFRQYIQLSDGSVTFVTSISPQKPLIKLTADSLSHPSWNPEIRYKLLSEDNGQITKFKDKFGNLEEEDLIKDLQFKQVTSMIKEKVKVKPKKK